MSNQIKPSELVINQDGSIYHLNLKPEQIATTIIFVGDQNRVPLVSQYFDTIECQVEKREFVTHTGTYKGKRLSVISTGIGADNIDIVLTELDALVNIDFEKRTVKENHTALNIIRIGTSGALLESIPLGSIVISTHGLGIEGIPYYYDNDTIFEIEMEDEFIKHTNYPERKARPYIVECSQTLLEQFNPLTEYRGITYTANSFYGGQNRVLRLKLSDINLSDKMKSFRFNDTNITNLEMETAAIYALSKMLGHHALSLNCVLANRAKGIFYEEPKKAINDLIIKGLEQLIKK